MNRNHLYVAAHLCFCTLGIVLCSVGCGPAQSGESAEQSSVFYRLQAELAQAERVEAAGGEVLNVAFVGVETVFNSELMAPYDVIQHTIFRDTMRYMLPFIVSPDGRPFVTFEGIEVRPHFSFDDAPPIDVLIIPSSNNSMTLDLENDMLMNWLEKTIAEATYVITVCDGAFPLAATGALDGRVATTFPGDRDRFADMFPEIDVRYDVNFVADGKYITSVGGALSYEPAFYLVEKLYSKENADRIAEGLVWSWNLEQVPHVEVGNSPTDLLH